MGVVFRAHDPELDRPVAVKLLVAARASGTEGTQRLVREARALARLAHPNVVEIYDVGTWSAGQTPPRSVFIAMELVSGRTLDRWLAQEEPRAPEILEVYEQAGLGLAAAHRAGLVHRDFKPSNAIIDAEGRVRVLDFGLARLVGDATSGTTRAGSASEAPEERSDPTEDRLTRTGIAMGTPMYMAPEQHAGHDADARADQYAFAVALWEALLGTRPFAGRSIDEIAAAKRQRAPNRGSATPRVPARVTRALGRALHPDPGQRFESMDALLSALTGRKRSRWAMGLGATAALAITGLAVAGSSHDDPCRDVGQELEAVWTSARKAEVGERFLATELAFAPQTWKRVSAQLDAYAQEWTSVRTELCLAAAAEHEGAGIETDRRRACLDQRRAQLATMLDVFATAQVADVMRAADSVAHLQSPGECRDLAGVDERQPTPDAPELARDVAAVREVLARVDALQQAGRIEQAEEAAERAESMASGLDYPPLALEVQLRLGRVDQSAGRYEDAARRLEEVALAASGAGRDHIAAQTKSSLVAIVGYHLADFDAAQRWGRDARAHLARLHSPGMLEARLENSLGQAAERAGRLEDARRHHEASVALREQLLPRGHPDLGSAMLNLGNAYHLDGKHEEALALYDKVLVIWESHLGPDHPDLGGLHANLGSVAFNLGRTDNARRHLARSLEILELAYGPEHPDVAVALVTLADVLSETDPVEAREAYRRALQIFEAALGPEHPNVAVCANNLGHLLADQGEVEAGLALFAKAVGIYEAALGPEHRQLAEPLHALGKAKLELGQPGAAEPLRRAVALFESGGAPDETLDEARETLARAERGGPTPPGVAAPP